MFDRLVRRAHVAWLRRKMRSDWNARASEDALHFVNTGGRGWDEDDFFATGEQNVREQITCDMQRVCQGRDPARMRVVEIGCGVGRMTRALAGVFGEVHGVDISDEMVRRARRYLRESPNAHVHRNTGSSLEVLGDMQFDFAFSYIVFQHIPSRLIIDGYVHEVFRRLRPGSLFKFQVQGFDHPSLRRMTGDTWLGVSVSEDEARDMAIRNGFRLIDSTGAGTQDYWLWYLRP